MPRARWAVSTAGCRASDVGLYAVDLDHLDQRIAQMSRFEAWIQMRLARLETEIETLHESWTGLAATAQRRAHDEWTRGADEMRTALVELRRAAEVAHRNYTSAADANVSMWRNVT